LAFTRQNVQVLDRTLYASAEGLRRGAYVLADAHGGKPDLILIASGSEVPLIVGAQKKLQEQGLQARIVSMPSWELFDAQPKEYRDAVLPPAVRSRLAVEAGVTQGWHKYVGMDGDVIGLDRFGASAPYTVIFEKLGFTTDNVVARALKLMKK
jgi:transketolase